MGCKNLIGAAEPLWLQYRDQFPVTQELIYLNHAGVAPLCRRSAEAMQNLAGDVLRFGSYHYEQWLAAYAGVRSSAGRLINCTPEEIAIIKNTSEGVATVALGFDWRPGDRIVAFEEEFPANFMPWKRLESRGVQITWLSCESPLERIEDACRGARLLAISFVQYLSGFRANLHQIGAFCARNGVFFFVDAIQGLGAFPLDVNHCHIDALAADGHKWLLGPEGCGILFVRREMQDRIEPVEFGWTNTANFADYASREMTLRADAGRYECGTLNTIGCFGLHAAMEFLLEVGVERIATEVRARVDEIAAGAAAKGYEILGTRTPETSAGIVSVRKPSIDSRMTVHGLKERKIIAAPRQGWVRMAPHFYISPEEIQEVIAALP